MNQLEVHFNPTNQDTTNVTVAGPFTSMNAIQFKQDLMQYLENNDGHCNIDISHVKQMDLTAFNALLMAQKKLSKQGKRLIVKPGKNSPVYELMHLTKFGSLFTIEN